MSTKTVVTFEDDLTGKEYEEGETITFALDGKTYEVDLAKANAKKFRAVLQKHAEAGRRVRTFRTTSSTRSGAHKGRTAEIRHWAQSNGYSVGDRGRIPGPVQDAYRKAHAKDIA